MGIPARISDGIRMLIAVKLDDQPRFKADKIQDVTIVWKLPLEFQTVQLPVA